MDASDVIENRTFDEIAVGELRKPEPNAHQG